ncbi:D-ribose pyranase [Virgibacillus dakarensis]|uniref:D-ribose pyranase n=1 Tax=Lentibacillus populi TaxID=1827502 RepID=A0A9W5TY60_9BACI|nr:D-ribose pyranase [Lentibacillus populi]MBT2217555.1 D-ribose pyranase [Virgibacillus dakarensis]MTW87921.1 D-ribose pyranase [Virgibacillus dakarensis]GGB45676.1 D-ribose pyranase [Lentibacillus populi]
MKKFGMLNRDISSLLSRLGHTDKILIADCGLPVPDETLCIDLSLRLGIPSFETVLNVIAEDMQIEKMILANEIKTENSVLDKKLLEGYPTIPVEYIMHEELKKRIKEMKAVIRTGEATPYANVIVQSGVIF